MMGPTGAGKTVQAAQLAATRGWAHLSTGELLRRDPEQAQQLQSGHLAPEAEVERVLAAALSRLPAEQTVVLDGFPRTIDEAKWLDAHLPDWSRRLERVVLVDVDAATSAERLQTRGRSDDSPAAQGAKWREYETVTRPVLDYYEDRHELTAVDGRGSVEAVADRIKELLT
jgi:adenylate kinase